MIPCPSNYSCSSFGYSGCSFSPNILVAVTTPELHAARRLPAVDPNVAKALAIISLGQVTFGLVGLYFDNYVGDTRDLEDN
jgi:hypothetical protein